MTDANFGGHRFGRPIWLNLALLILCGFLIFYHGRTGIGMLGNGALDEGFQLLQLALKALIIVSLILLLIGRKIGLAGMWVGIGLLIATQLWAHLGGSDMAFTQGRSTLSYLRGLILPTIITALLFVPAKGKTAHE